MKFGYFDDAHREYVITTPKTPSPGLTIWDAGNFSHSSQTPAAAILSTKTQSSCVSPATATTMCPTIQTVNIST